MARKKPILTPVLFMVALTMVYTFALAFVNESSLSRIQQQEQLVVQRSVLYALNIPDGDYEQMVEKKGDMYVYEEDGVIKGFVYPFTGKGLWGSISGYLAFSPDYTSIIGIDFTAHSETPGLGGRIDELWFKDQFRGISTQTRDSIVFRPSEGGNADAITGATLTSKAVSNIVNAFIEEVLQNERID